MAVLLFLNLVPFDRGGLFGVLDSVFSSKWDGISLFFSCLTGILYLHLQSKALCGEVSGLYVLCMDGSMLCVCVYLAGY